ncbi:MAG: hypothetical protein K0S80_173 [Neobacillus sp.]|nr:hypothetical protein [Neobacillus sp.]
MYIDKSSLLTTVSALPQLEVKLFYLLSDCFNDFLTDSIKARAAGELSSLLQAIAVSMVVV